MMKLYRPFRLVLTETAKNFIYSSGTPCITKDFTGYSIAVTEKYSALVYLNGMLYIYRTKSRFGKYNISKREWKKVFKLLINTGFLKEVYGDEPFSEFEESTSLTIDPKTALRINGYLFSHPYTPVDPTFKPDDDVDDKNESSVMSQIDECINKLHITEEVDSK